MALYEVLLRRQGRSELRLHDRPLAHRQTLKVAGTDYCVIGAESAENPLAETRYVCVPLLELSSSGAADGVWESALRHAPSEPATA